MFDNERFRVFILEPFVGSIGSGRIGETDDKVRFVDIRARNTDAPGLFTLASFSNWLISCDIMFARTSLRVIKSRHVSVPSRGPTHMSDKFVLYRA